MTGITAPPVEEFATGFLRTAVHEGDHGYVWIRRPGADRPSPLTPPGQPVRDAIRALRLPDLRLALPEVVADALHYRVPGPVAVAKLCVGSDPRLTPQLVTSALSGTGAALRLLHSAVPGSRATSGPAGPARLAAWMLRGRGPRAATAFHTVVRRQLGSGRWSQVQDWCASLATDLTDGVFLHGAPSLGSVIAGSRPGEGCLLIGEDVARGPADFDLGWLLGEFAEWRMTLLRRTPGLVMDPRDYHAALTGLCRAYGAPDEPATVGRAAVLRIFTHAHDFAAYMGWHPELTEYASTIAELIDEDGAQTLPGPLSIL
ncbi:hypothetical protein ABZY06_27060 [Streptomyces sp. NPDC006540]|jgi:hypothetical protein|uniref:hypothetical protein n=1 Tax=Streptomyces sp. NPDC006540 TaxID=3155353 RepID=UPI0033B46159